jgi:nicotinamidase-related amidase
MVQPHRQALLIIAVFNDFRFEGGPQLAEQFRKIIPAIALLCEHFCCWGVPMVFVNDNLDCWHEDLDDVIAYAHEVGHPVSRWRSPRPPCGSWSARARGKVGA